MRRFSSILNKCRYIVSWGQFVKMSVSELCFQRDVYSVQKCDMLDWLLPSNPSTGLARTYTWEFEFINTVAASWGKNCPLVFSSSQPLPSCPQWWAAQPMWCPLPDGPLNKCLVLAHPHILDPNVKCQQINQCMALGWVLRRWKKAPGRGSGWQLFCVCVCSLLYYGQ